MSAFFLMDVDTQRDFMLAGGALYSPGAERIIPRIREIFGLARRLKVPVLSSVDAHGENDPEFERFPPHCVRGTRGQHKIPESLLPLAATVPNDPAISGQRNLQELLHKHQQVIIEKQDLDVFSNPVTARLLHALPPRAIVFGVYADYCVRCAVLGLRNQGVQTVVLTDAIRSVEPEAGRKAIEEMGRAGAEWLETRTLLQTAAVAES